MRSEEDIAQVLLPQKINTLVIIQAEQNNYPKTFR